MTHESNHQKTLKTGGSLVFQRFRHLLASPFYDTKRDSWIQVITKDQKPLLSSVSLEAQLWYIILLAKLFPKKAPAVLKKFEQEHFFQGYILSQDQRDFGTSNAIANLELLYIIAEKLCNPDSLMPRLKELMKLPLFHPHKKLWYYSIRTTDNTLDVEFHAHTQLLYTGLLCLSNKKLAEQHLQKLQKENFFSPPLQMWMRSENANGKTLVSDISSSTQLLYIALLCMMSKKEEAQKLFDRLRKSPLYDTEHGQWLGACDENLRLLGTNRYAHSQLIGVAAEYFLL